MGTQTVVDVRPRAIRDTVIADLVAFDPSSRIEGDMRVLVSGVANATRLVQLGDLFAALPGANSHGAQFVSAAREKGAVAVLTDERGLALLRRDDGTTDLPVIVSADPRRALGPIAAAIYGNTSQRIKTLGVTGTNGKTTVTYFAEAILAGAGYLTGMSATPERHVGSTVVGSGLTTPEAPVLQGMIARMRELGATALALEVSAQAVTKHRIAGVRFDAVGFMNLNAEHLDEYADMQSYYEAKRGLFRAEYASRAVIALADEWALRLVGECEIPVETLRASWWDDFSGGTTTDNVRSAPQWLVTEFNDTETGCACIVVAPGGHRFPVRAGLPGRHVAVDAAMAIALVSALGVDPGLIEGALNRGVLEDTYIPGRLEQVSGNDGPLVIIDYAHTPAAMADTLVELRRRTRGRLITAFGADGGRDPFKRRGMAIAAATNADLVFICDAHPRTEDPAGIRAELLAAAREVPDAQLREIADPAEAIRAAIALLEPSDTFVVLGPGDEDYRAVGTQEIPYSARDEARDALRARGLPVREAVRKVVDQ